MTRALWAAGVLMPPSTRVSGSPPLDQVGVDWPDRVRGGHLDAVNGECFVNPGLVDAPAQDTYARIDEGSPAWSKAGQRPVNSALPGPCSTKDFIPIF
jgi:hypothetical protein